MMNSFTECLLCKANPKLEVDREKDLFFVTCSQAEYKGEDFYISDEVDRSCSEFQFFVEQPEVFRK